MMRPTRRPRMVLAAPVAAIMLLGACSESGNSAAAGGEGADGADASEFTLDGPATLIIPFGSGGGVDLAGRTVVNTLRDEGIVDEQINVENVEGGSATLGMSQVQREEGNGDTLMITGTHLVTTPLLVPDSGLSYQDFTPLATLFAEYVYFFTAPDSDYQSIQDVADALQEDPGSVRIGGGHPGGSSHFAVARFASSLGVELEDLTYVTYDDNEMIPAVLGGHVDIASSGPELLDLVEAGELEALAVSSQEPVGGTSEGIPTFADGGSDAEVVNWRIISGPPDMPEEAVGFWQDAFEQMSETDAWQGSMDEYGWAPYFQVSDLDSMLAEENEAYSAVLSEMGLTDG